MWQAQHVDIVVIDNCIVFGYRILAGGHGNMFTHTNSSWCAFEINPPLIYFARLHAWLDFSFHLKSCVCRLSIKRFGHGEYNKKQLWESMVLGTKGAEWKADISGYSSIPCPPQRLRTNVGWESRR